ncbi:hypothetical protein E2C01_079968 [Portunus trituberculatus]|uniref:Uncharacterized protein n=1 Tax=Portunus trituberculatus TaxID=210409 RepID=A0A5B7IRX6_PORTR|nr:hypothetical protein [Portunus trituberculatus]
MEDSDVHQDDYFYSFNGAVVNVTALPYKPYWTEKEGEAETVVYSGSDRLMLEAMADALNFTIHVLPVATWEEAS